MVAETHSHDEDVTFADVAAFVLVELGGLGAEADPRRTTLADCGYELTLEIVDLVTLVGEEFGERTLSVVDVDELDSDTLVGDLIDQLYPELPPNAG